MLPISTIFHKLAHNSATRRDVSLQRSVSDSFFNVLSRISSAASGQKLYSWFYYENSFTLIPRVCLIVKRQIKYYLISKCLLENATQVQGHDLTGKGHVAWALVDPYRRSEEI